MPLTVARSGDQYVVTGVTRDDAVTSPLGRRYFPVGPHLIGFDDNFAEPVIVRAYYDPAKDPVATRLINGGTIEYIGYLQFIQLSFRGTPIPPAVYGGRLADRQPYVYGDDLRFVDFMGPADAHQRNVATPFYPINALLVNGNLTDISDFFYHPLENGSLFSPRDLDDDKQSAAASLFAEIAPGLVTPDAVARCLTAENQILVLSPSPADLAASEPYQLVLAALRPPPANAPLAGLANADIAAQVIGEYVLLTLPDPEDFGDTLVISTRPRPGGGTDVVVNLITDYELEGVAGDVGREALLRIRDYQAEVGDVDSEDLADAPSYGRNGLLTAPFQLDPAEFAAELRYWTMAVAVRTLRDKIATSRYLLSGFTWSALFEFDEDTGAMNFAAIKEPAMDSFYLHPGLRAFWTARDSPQAAGQLIDTSNFTLAAMRRDNFAAGSKLRFVDASGADLAWGDNDA
ncbi:MAG TPA: hypothetical protein VMA95_07910 [Streptosporangiaceae bacterium]|nr:hypothetical protein [Streptosporangiaceae bacterium]